MNKIEKYLLMKKIMKKTCPTCVSYPSTCHPFRSGDSFETAAKKENNRSPLRKIEIEMGKLGCYVAKSKVESYE